MKPFLAVNFDWEALLPLLLFLLYGLSQFIGSRKKSGEAEQELFEEPDPDLAEQEERARQIREEIRRRVAGRQEGEQAKTFVPEREQPVAPAPVQRSRTSVAPRSAHSGGGADGGMIARLTEQKRRLEHARREKVKAERESRSIHDKAQRSGSRYKRRVVDPTAELTDAVSVREDVLDILADPANARRGILLSEILGPPVGSKPHQTDRF
ncbi:MAG: hypothetical protein JJU20_04225 [Opitutales bacterium]|nr:hypothetical protein [Opitutales bacterium]